MRTRVRKKQVVKPMEKLKDFVGTLFLHLSFYAFIFMVVYVFIEFFSV
ncbi:hypothetical protein [Bacillus massilinigeriensis]|nr:hypothetical protein [Bacillus mediterraneensis]